MKEWDYIDDIPFIPIKLIGGNLEIIERGIVDTGARFVVLHERLAKRLKLETIDFTEMLGFGSKKKFMVDLKLISVEIDGIVDIIQCAVIKERYYPPKVPWVVIGRNLLNKFKITLDGRNKKIRLE